MNIEFECEKCQSRFSIRPEHAGKRVRCPKCGEVNAVPHDSNVATSSKDIDNPPEARPEPTWTVVTNNKKRTGVPRSKLHASASKGGIPDSLFVKAEGFEGDWQQASTTDWLVDKPSPATVRYCGACGARIRGTQEKLEQTFRCPECSSSTNFIDYLQVAPPPIAEIPVEPWGKYDWAILGVSAVALIFLLCAAVSLFFDPLLAVLFSFLFAAVGSFVFVVSYQHRSDCSKYTEHLQKVEVALSGRTSQLATIHSRYQNLQNDLTKVRDNLVAETQIECERIRAAAQDHLDYSEQQADTVHRVAEKYLDEQRKWWTQKLRGDNYALQKGRIEKAVQFVEKEAYEIPDEIKREIFSKLQHDYEMRLRKEREQERQKELRAQIREEQKAEKEAAEAKKRADEERKAIEAALSEALNKAGAEHSAEVEELKRQLQEAEERGQRAVAQAQLTKVGHVYVISNLGSFGDDVFKVGLTRRLEPLDRVKELGDASVPFPFDVHMMIFSEDAPALEHQLHKSLHDYRVNRVNFRKEFFRVDLTTIHKLVTELHGEVEYIADAEALEYRRGLELSEEDFDYLEAVAERQGIDSEDDDDD